MLAVIHLTASGESKKGRTADALAPEGDERRGKLRKSMGRRKQPLIHGCLNGATRQADGLSLILGMRANAAN